MCLVYVPVQAATSRSLASAVRSRHLEVLERELASARKLYFDLEQPAEFQLAVDTLHVWIAHRDQLTVAMTRKVTGSWWLLWCFLLMVIFWF